MKQVHNLLDASTFFNLEMKEVNFLSLAFFDLIELK